MSIVCSSLRVSTRKNCKYLVESRLMEGTSLLSVVHVGSHKRYRTPDFWYLVGGGGGGSGTDADRVCDDNKMITVVNVLGLRIRTVVVTAEVLEARLW